MYKDDQSIIFNVKDKGLVVVMGCAHAGAINTMKICKELNGEEGSMLGGRNASNR
ncbi:MAG TPA: hypothetical protein VE619_10310 [Nitrososphaeraceae archaeon]|nr:hypothetical protein [Nitrososphaeraceae archaeon]